MLTVYRQAVISRLQRQIGDERWDPEAVIRAVEHYLPELVAVAHAVGPNDLVRFEETFEHTICLQCGWQTPLGACLERELDTCSLHHYLPLIYDAIHRADTLGGGPLR